MKLKADHFKVHHIEYVRAIPEHYYLALDYWMVQRAIEDAVEEKFPGALLSVCSVRQRNQVSYALKVCIHYDGWPPLDVLALVCERVEVEITKIQRHGPPKLSRKHYQTAKEVKD